MIRLILSFLIILYLVFFPNENFSEFPKINNKKPPEIDKEPKNRADLSTLLYKLFFFILFLYIYITIF